MACKLGLNLTRCVNIPVKLAKDETNNFKILPIRSTSVTRPVEMKVAHTLTAADANSGVESAPKAGVSAELI